MIDALAKAVEESKIPMLPTISVLRVGGREITNRKQEIIYCTLAYSKKRKKVFKDTYIVKNCLNQSDFNYQVSSYEELEEIGKTNADIMWILKYTNIKELFPLARAHPNKTIFYSIDYIKYIQDGGEIE
jgi:hypothetical protein